MVVPMRRATAAGAVAPVPRPVSPRLLLRLENGFIWRRFGVLFDLKNSRSVLETFGRGGCLTVGAFGGSVTVGTCLSELLTVSPEDTPRSSSETWPLYFQAELNNHFPCEGEGHRVLNFGKNYVTSDYWINHFLDPANSKSLASLDAVILDTSINEILGKNGGSNPKP
jgi:hypothetical protein